MNSNTGSDANLVSKTPIYNNVRFFKIFTALSALALSLSGGFAFAFDFDISSMYLGTSPLTYVFYAIIILTVAALALFSIISSKGCIYPNTYRAGTWLGAYAAVDLISFLVIISKDFIIFPVAGATSTSEAVLAVSKGLLIIAVCLVTMIYFTGYFKKALITNTVLGVFAVLWCTVIIAMTYLDNGVAINSPYELICQFGLAFAMLFIICELRFSLGSEKYGMYKFTGGVTFCLNLLACVASMILAAKGLYELPLYSLPASAMTIYSAKIFFARKSPLNSASDSDKEFSIIESSDIYEDSSIPDNFEERTPTDENTN